MGVNFAGTLFLREQMGALRAPCTLPRGESDSSRSIGETVFIERKDSGPLVLRRRVRAK